MPKLTEPPKVLNEKFPPAENKYTFSEVNKAIDKYWEEKHKSKTPANVDLFIFKEGILTNLSKK